MQVTLLHIGDELLIGQVDNTNASWMAQALDAIGARIVEITVVGDDKQHIQEALCRGLAQSDAVVMTGGLGPTRDDLTKEALATFFGVEQVFSEDCWRHVQRLFARFGKTLDQTHRAQCWVPTNARLLPNHMGTAPGMWFEHGEKVVVALPGVPFEMKHLMERHVLPQLQARFGAAPHLHRTICTFGEAESVLAQRLHPFERQLPPQLSLAYLPSLFQVRLRLTAKGADEATLRPLLDEQTQKLVEALGPCVFSTEGEQLEEALGRSLRRCGLTIATAESCTGGYVAHKITSVPGASDYFLGAVVAYANEVKVGLLGVSAEDLRRHGAVSKAVAMQMAKGVRTRLQTDLAVATTGIAGPSGGSTDKPVGTVWVAAALGDQTIARKHQFGKKRAQNIEMSAMAALALAWELLHRQEKCAFSPC